MVVMGRIIIAPGFVFSVRTMRSPNFPETAFWKYFAHSFSLEALQKGPQERVLPSKHTNQNQHDHNTTTLTAANQSAKTLSPTQVYSPAAALTFVMCHFMIKYEVFGTHPPMNDTAVTPIIPLNRKHELMNFMNIVWTRAA